MRFKNKFSDFGFIENIQNEAKKIFDCFKSAN